MRISALTSHMQFSTQPRTQVLSSGEERTWVRGWFQPFTGLMLWSRSREHTQMISCIRMIYLCRIWTIYISCICKICWLTDVTDTIMTIDWIAPDLQSSKLVCFVKKNFQNLSLILAPHIAAKDFLCCSSFSRY